MNLNKHGIMPIILVFFQLSLDEIGHFLKPGLLVGEKTGEVSQRGVPEVIKGVA